MTREARLLLRALSPEARRSLRRLPPHERSRAEELIVLAFRVQQVSAYHEAAHVVVGLLHGLRVRSVTIVPEPALRPPAGVPAGTIGGRTEFETPRRVTLRKRRGLAIAMLAGEYGELLLDPGARDAARDHAMVDRLEVVKALAVPDPETFRGLGEAAQVIVNAPLVASAVRDLARALLRRKTLTDAAARRIVARQLPSVRSRKRKTRAAVGDHRGSSTRGRLPRVLVAGRSRPVVAGNGRGRQ